jgi:branched-chain amino acid transport system permease protein
MLTTEDPMNQSTITAAPGVATGKTLAPARQIDWAPLLLVPLIALLALPLIQSTSTWVTLTAAGLAMGMIIFLCASGLTLIFGLMDVLNFGHGLFIALGAYIAVSVFGQMPGWAASENLGENLGAIGVAMVGAIILAGLVGIIFERILIKRVYGWHLMQILITIGGAVVGEELIKVWWGPNQLPLVLPPSLRGSFILGDAAVEKYRIFAVVVGLVIFGLMMLILNGTKIGLLVRAGVQDREMVESLGYRIRRLFIAVFIAGTALAGIGGVMWGLYQQAVIPQIGAQVNTLIFIVIIIGGLGSTGGSFLGALLVGLVNNYIGFLSPKLALFSTILLMVVILVWRPNGLYKVTNR